VSSEEEKKDIEKETTKKSVSGLVFEILYFSLFLVLYNLLTLFVGGGGGGIVLIAKLVVKLVLIQSLRFQTFPSKIHNSGE
jgi:hypothetical protein